MGVREIKKESIKIKERTVDFIIDGTEAVTESAEIPPHLIDKASETFVEQMGVIFADIVFDIGKDKYIVKGFYQEA